MLQYDPKDASPDVWPKGDYDATLDNVENTNSKAGKPMQVWTFTVYAPDGSTQEIKDYVVIPAALFKVKQLAIALGKREEFEAATFQPEDNIGCGMTAVLAIEEQQGFDDKNRIAKVKAKAPNGTPVARPAPAPNVGRAGIQRPPKPAPADVPFGDEKQFVEDDIPF